MLKNFKPVSLILCAGALCFSGSMYANIAPVEQGTSISQQNGKVTGTVEDDFGPVTGASVVVKGTSNGTITDMDGNFTLDGVKNGDVIQISFIGYSTMELTYTGKPVGVIKLAEDTQKLDEVVVTALGIKREKKALGYATQELKGDELVNARESNIANALSGKVSGLQVVRSSSGPGGSSKIVLRGNNSLTGSNQPLIVVDGIPMDNFTGGVDDAWGNSGVDMGNGLSDINPEDIESMNVLKGASAAALYGSRAGNGVILITTKSGKKQSGLGITVNAGVTVESMFLKPELQNTYGQGTNGIYNVKDRSSWGPVADGSVTIDRWDGQKVQMYTYDNIDAYFQKGTSFNEGVSFQQSYDGTAVFASINRSDDKGIVPGASLNKTSLTLRGTSEFGPDKRWKLDAKANYLNNNAKNRPIQGINQSNAFSTIYNLPRSLDIRDLENCLDENGNMIWWDTESTPQENPYWIKDYRTNQDSRNRLLGTISLSYKITDWWNLELKGGTDYYTTTTTNKVYSGGNVNPKGRYSEKSETFYENNYSFLTTFKKDNLFSKFGGFVTVGGNLMMQRRKKLEAGTGDLLIPNLFAMSNAADKNNMTHTSEDVQRKMNSIYGSLQMNWDGWLFMDITARNDWSSTLANTESMKNGFFYPSVGLTWIMSNSIKLPEWINFSKFRGSFAQVGNDLPIGITNLADIIQCGGSIQTNDIEQRGDLKPEISTSIEFGTEWKFFNNRFGIDFTWYRTDTKNQLLRVANPAGSLYAFRYINAGKIRNTGIELTLEGTPLMNENFRWKTAVNMSMNRNKVVSLHKDYKSFRYGSEGFSMAYDMWVKEGGKLGDIYGNGFERDENGKIKLNETGNPIKVTGNNTLLGNANPDALLGWSNTFTYKGFTLYFLIDARIGGDVMSLTQAHLDAMGVSKESGESRDRGYVEYEGIQFKDVPNFYGTVGGRNGISEYYMYDATNVRLRELTLGYSFPETLLAKTKFIKGLDLTLVARNLFFLYKDAPFDPDATLSVGNTLQGVDVFGMPTTRNIGFNVKFTF